MKKLSNKVSLEFFIFVLSVLIVVVIAFSLSLSHSARDEYTRYLEIKKQNVYKWFAELRNEYKQLYEVYIETGIVDDDIDLLIELEGDGRVNIVKNLIGVGFDEIARLVQSGSKVVLLNSEPVYLMVFETPNKQAIIGSIFDGELIGSLSKYLGEDATVFISYNDHYIVPQEFIQTGIYVRSVIQQSKEATSRPFVVSQPRGILSIFGWGQVYLTDSVDIAGVKVFVLQSVTLLVQLVNRLIPIMFLIVVGVVFFSLVFSWSLNRYISTALDSILSGFTSIRDGSFERVEFKSNDELGKISMELNKTMEFIEMTLEKLRKSNELLRKATAEARQASRMKSEFLANMSHEMRTPMNAILGFTELLLNEETNEEKRKHLVTIYRSGEHLLSLINDVLDLSKIESGKMQIYEEIYSPRNLLKELVETYLPMAYSKGLHLAYSLDNNVPEYVVGDAFRIKQILTNLVSNGIKFTSQGYITIQANYKEGKITYIVNDTGIGIPEEKLDKIFEPFTQLDGTMSRKYGGTGLGLAITKKLVDLMNGKLYIESHMGKGTKVVVSLPTKLPSKEEIEKVINKKEDTNKVVLIAGKDKNFFENIASLLSRYNIKHRTTLNISMLPLLCKEAKYMLVIVDLDRISENDLSILDTVKKSETPVVLVAKDARENIEGFEVLTRPISEKKLIEIISRYLKEDLYPVHEFSGKEILVVEDNKANQVLIKKMLEKVGFKVNVAGNGKEALEKIKEKTYSLIIMDMQMPVMDGYTATRKIREKGLKVPVIALTAHTLRGDEAKSLEAGCDGYLGKPVKQKELIDAIVYFLRIQEELETTRFEPVQTPDQKTGKAEEKIGEPPKNPRNDIEKRIQELSTNMGLTLEEAREMFEEYENYLRESIMQLKELSLKEDFEAIDREGHSLKGSGKMYSVVEVSEIGVKLQNAAKAKKKDKILQLISELEKLIDQIWGSDQNS